MSLRAWRIVKARHVARAFSGEGARQYGGRWNSPGVGVVYTAGSSALAVLEMLVHLENEEKLGAFRLFTVEFDERLVETVSVKQLPRNWMSDPSPEELARIGNDWVAESRSAVMRVPSVLIEDEWNYLLNPSHLSFDKIKVGPPRSFRFDPRLRK